MLVRFEAVHYSGYRVVNDDGDIELAAQDTVLVEGREVVVELDPEILQASVKHNFRILVHEGFFEAVVDAGEVLDGHSEQLKGLGFVELTIGYDVVVVVGLSLSDGFVDRFQGFFEPPGFQLDHDFI